jgi:hypothetical protein
VIRRTCECLTASGLLRPTGRITRGWTAWHSGCYRLWLAEVQAERLRVETKLRATVPGDKLTKDPICKPVAASRDLTGLLATGDPHAKGCTQSWGFTSSTTMSDEWCLTAGPSLLLADFAFSAQPSSSGRSHGRRGHARPPPAQKRRHRDHGDSYRMHNRRARAEKGPQSGDGRVMTNPVVCPHPAAPSKGRGRRLLTYTLHKPVTPAQQLGSVDD